jgi:signal transduction histidine kinase
LVEAMGGRLWIATTEGPGATFAFSLPAERIEEA